MAINYQKKWVEAILMMPTYIVTPIYFSYMSAALYLPVLLLILFFTRVVIFKCN